MTPQQSKAARAVLDWTMEETAQKAGIGAQATLTHFESGQKKPQSKTLERLKASYEAAGVRVGEDGCSLSWELKPSS